MTDVTEHTDVADYDQAMLDGMPPIVAVPVPIMARIARVAAAVGVVKRNQTAKIKENFEYSYVDINSILHMLKPLLAERNLAIMQPLEVRDGTMFVNTLIVDTETGENINFGGPGFPVKGDPQAAGSAITYMRRYGIVSLFGLEASDDDGATAGRQARDPQRRTEAEGLVRDGLAGLGADVQREFAADFVEEFGSTLTNLPESRHGDALTFFRFWMRPPEPDETEPEIDHDTGDGY